MTSAEDQRNPANWTLKGTVLFASVPVALAYSVVSPILAKMSDELAHGAKGAYLVKMIVGIIGVAMVPGAPIAGLLADKLGRRPVLVGAALIESHRSRTVGWVRGALALAPALGVTALEPLVIRLGVDSVLLLIAGVAGLMLVGVASRVFTLVKRSSPIQHADG